MIKEAAVASALVLSLTLFTPPAFAADPPSPGTVDDTLRPPPTMMPPPEVPPIDVPQRPEARVPAGGTPVPVQRFNLTGNTLLDDAELRGILARYEGRPHTLEEIYAIADYLTDLYRHYGFTLANVVVPAQRIDQGEVTLRVIEGRIGSVRVEGAERYQHNVVTSRMPSLAAGMAFRAADMERELIRLNDLPGLTARAVVRPGAEFGTSDVVIRVVEDKSNYRLAVDNYGRDSIGEWRGTADATWNSPRGVGDRLSLSGLVSEGGLLTFVRGAYGVPVGLTGDRVRFSFSHAAYEVGGVDFAGLDIEGKSSNLRLEYSRPVVRSRTTTLVLSAALSYNRSDVDALGQPISDSRLSLLETTAFWSTVTNRGIAASVTGTLGTNFRNNPQGLRNNAQRARVRADGTLTVPLAANSVILFRGGGAFSPDPLADVQKFSLGGPWMLRGYQPSDARGDIGHYVSVEAQYTVRAMRDGRPFFNTTWGLFIDNGRVKRRRLPGDAVDTVYSDDLRNYGVSFLFDPGNGLNVTAAWAKPFSNYPGSDGTTDGQLWLSVSGNF